MIGTVSGTGAIGTFGASQGPASVSTQDFLQVLVKELTTQDPLDPLDQGELVQQLIGLQTLDHISALTTSLTGFRLFLQATAGSVLLGKTVKADLPGGGTVEGLVSRVILQGGQASVVIGTETVPLDSIREIA